MDEKEEITIKTKKPQQKEKRNYSYNTKQTDKNHRFKENIEKLANIIKTKITTLLIYLKKNPQYIYIIILFLLTFFIIIQYNINNNINYKGDLKDLIESTNKQSTNILQTNTELDSIKTNLNNLQTNFTKQQTELKNCNEKLIQKQTESTENIKDKEQIQNDLTKCKQNLENQTDITQVIKYILDKYNVKDITELDNEITKLKNLEILYNNIPIPIKEAYK
jgi:nitrate/nitrite-specific signal transduction histidine kinase